MDADSLDPCDLVSEALEIEDPGRAARVPKTRACAGDRELTDRVNAMLEFHNANHPFLSEGDISKPGLSATRFGEGVGFCHWSI